MSPLQLVLVAAVGFAGSFYGVVSGGGGLLIIPGLVIAGMPAPAAVASSRLGVLALSIAGAYRFRRAGLVQAGASLPLMATVTGGAVLGALALLSFNPLVFQRLFGALTVLLAPLILFGRRLGLERAATAPSAARRATGYALVFVIGIYAGLFGAGWATFFTYVMVSAFGRSFLEGAATRTFVGLAVGLSTTVIFGLGGQIVVAPAAVLFGATMAGSYLGASYSLRRGERYARQLVALVAALAGLKLLV
jgi:uncharacterized membrane protein YfcA